MRPAADFKTSAKKTPLGAGGAKFSGAGERVKLFLAGGIFCRRVFVLGGHVDHAKRPHLSGGNSFFPKI